MSAAVSKPFYTEMLDEARSFAKWCLANPSMVLIGLSLLGTFIYFFFFLHLFQALDQRCSAYGWAWQAWNPDMNQSHGKLVPLISLGLLWYHREEIRSAQKAGSNKGLIFLAIGLLLYVLSARCIQPRLALTAVPFLIYGTILYLWGPAVARIVLFPCAFLIFTVPVAVVEQATFRLQFIITGIVGFLTGLVGIGVQAVGTTLNASDGSFNFQVAEGCSGIRSLAAMTMLTAVYVHITQSVAWKKIVIFALSILFAIIGNAGRIFTVVLVAKFIDPKLAAGIYHDYSGYVFFPIAVAAMLGISSLLNFNWHEAATVAPAEEREHATYDY